MRKDVISERLLVSVVIVTYQQVDFIRECLESVLRQETNFLYEIIIGEDGSSDGTREICQEYALRHPELITLFFRDRKDVINVNGLPIGTYNFTQSLFAARGKYIALLEGDDYWLDPKKLQKQVNILEKYDDCILCHHWQRYAVKRGGRYEVIDKNDHGYYPKLVSNVERIFSNELRIKTRTLLFRNVISESFFPDWYFTTPFGDVALSFILGKYGNYYFIDEPMAVYRITETGSSSEGRAALGPLRFTQMHLREWIRVWDYGHIYHNYLYDYYYKRTVNSFIRQLSKNSLYSVKELLYTVRFVLLERKIPFKYRIQQTTVVLISCVRFFFNRQ